MAASPSSVLTRGLGSWGSVNLVVTLGYGIGAGPPPGMQFTTQRERLEFTVEEIPEFAEETALHFTTED